jgi:Family of unknown function (DUF5906)
MISPIENSRAATLYLARIGARMRTLFSATITTEALGYEKEVYGVRFLRDGQVRGPAHLLPTAAEADEIEKDIRAMTFPSQVTVAALSNSSLPELILNAPDDKLFIFRKPNNGPIRFIQVRIELENGDKRYIPQTLWDDGEWRAIEPEEGLPIYNIDKVRKGDRVFLHEGAKAAKAAEVLCRDPSHPFHELLDSGVHVGWIGGAHHINRTLWFELQVLQPGEIIIFPDNDFIGRSKVNEIAAKFRCPVSFIKMDAMWPKAWDIADPIPESMFSEDSETEVGGRYVGTPIEDMIVSCDWATEEIGFTENGRPIYGIREVFAQNWVRIQNIQHYAHISNPELSLNKDQFNMAVRPFSDVIDTSAALARFSGNICDKVTFMPSMPTGIVRLDGEYCLNQYVDRRLKPIKTNSTSDRTKPFWRFLEYLIPSQEERDVATSWIATLYAKPERRLAFGLLFLSKMQGVGKSTLLNIVGELIGRKHVSFPGDAMIQGDFNGWLVNKRLVVVHEIYAGQSWKTYNRLKTLITDEFVEANNKHVANYTLPNWTHFMAASNSMEALRIEADDRRWYVPGMPEYLYDGYNELRQWIRSGGLRYLAGEFADWNQFIRDGDQAPRTSAKTNLIDQSMPNDERLVLVMMERMDPMVCVDVKELWLWLQKEANNRAFVSPQRICSLLAEHGFVVDKPRPLGSRIRQVVWKDAESRAKVLKDLTGDAEIKEVIGSIKNPSEIFRSSSDM